MKVTNTPQFFPAREGAGRGCLSLNQCSAQAVPLTKPPPGTLHSRCLSVRLLSWRTGDSSPSCREDERGTGVTGAASRPTLRSALHSLSTASKASASSPAVSDKPECGLPHAPRNAAPAAENVIFRILVSLLPGLPGGQRVSHPVIKSASVGRSWRWRGQPLTAWGRGREAERVDRHSRPHPGSACPGSVA